METQQQTPKMALVYNEHQWYGDLGMVHLSVYLW